MRRRMYGRDLLLRTIRIRRSTGKEVAFGCVIDVGQKLCLLVQAPDGERTWQPVVDMEIEFDDGSPEWQKVSLN